MLGRPELSTKTKTPRFSYPGFFFQFFKVHRCRFCLVLQPNTITHPYYGLLDQPVISDHHALPIWLCHMAWLLSQRYDAAPRVLLLQGKCQEFRYGIGKVAKCRCRTLPHPYGPYRSTLLPIPLCCKAAAGTNYLVADSQ